MTKEELEKEAEENSFRYTLDKPWACEVERKQIMAHFEKGYLASAEPRENHIEQLEKENAVLERRIERAKECMKKLLFIINSDPANYNCKGLVQDAEDFIYNRTCNIRLHGEHCISETRCIMCDKEIEK